MDYVPFHLMTMPDTNRNLANLLLTMSDLLSTQTDNPYRVRAYRRAAQTIASLTEDIGAVSRRGELEELPGIGKDFAAKITEYLQTGRIQAYEDLKTPLPSHVLAWASLPGFSEPLVQHLYRHLHITTLDDLEALARSHLLQTRLSDSHTTTDILEAIQTLRKTQQAN